jgi:hypothetical protein
LGGVAPSATPLFCYYICSGRDSKRAAPDAGGRNNQERKREI